MTVALEGFHAVKHALRFAPELVLTIRAAHPPAAVELCARLAPDLVPTLSALVQAGPVDHRTGVAGTARRPPQDPSVLLHRSAPLVLLDAPRSPGNTGAVVRVAAAAGASGVAVSGGLDPWTPAAVRGSAGLHFALPVLWVADVPDLAGPLLALDPQGGPLGDVPDDAVLIVGSERAGLSPAMRARADALVALPMRAGVSSLNLATAVAAVLYRWRLG